MSSRHEISARAGVRLLKSETWLSPLVLLLAILYWHSEPVATGWARAADSPLDYQQLIDQTFGGFGRFLRKGWSRASG